MTRKYAGSYLYTNLGIREPKTLDELHDLYGITSYSTDVESYSYLYSTSSDTWLDPVSVQGATILYDSVNNLYFISNIFEDSGGTNRWFSINQLAIETYSSVGVSATGLSFSDTEVSVYNIETGDELKAIEYVDDKDSDTKKYLIKGEIDHFEWLTALQLEAIGYSLTSPIPEEVPSFVLLDNTTGEILHSSIGIMGYIPHTVIHKVQEDSVIYIDHSLPNVTQNNDFGSYNWLSTSTGSSEYILPGATSSELEYLENDSYYRPDYDSNNVYGIIQWQEVNGTLAGRTEFAIISAAEFGSSNKMLALNVSNDSLNFLCARVAVCDRHTAYIVPVYDSNNDAYNSFKFLMDGTYYYFVLDGVQNTWTDDLSTIGYTETQSLLPRVTFTGDAGVDNIIFGSDPQTSILGGNLAPNSSFEGLYYDNGYIPSIYDSSCVYAAIGWYTYIFNEFGGRTEVALLQGSFHQNTNAYIINIKNISSDAISLSKVKFATCHNSSATIATVYDSNNDSYNAFKYTLDGTDYYYVLDEIQSDWTDDLSSIGYSITPAVVLPIVSFTGDAGDDNWIAANSGSGGDLATNSSFSGYYWDGSAYQESVYNSSYVYAVIQWRKRSPFNEFGGRVEVSLINNGTINMKNVSPSTISLFQCNFAACHNSSTTVVTVYDLNNDAYNAFKYIFGVTEYYYVLDGSQSDWTDDLSSIGYSLDQTEPSFISDRFIDVTTETLALNPITHYGALGYGDQLDHFLWFENLARMPLNAYTTNTTQDFAFLSWGGDGSDGDFYPSIINQTEIPIEIWLKSDTQYVPESSVIESLGLTDEVDNCESGEALLRLIIQVSGGTLGNISFGNIVKSEFIKILYSDMCEFNAFGEDVHIQVNEPSLDYETMSCDDLPEIYFYNDWSLTDTVIVPISDCFLINDNDKITYCAFKTTIPANTIHINGSLYDKPLTVEFGSNTGLIVHESTPYDLQ